MNTHHAILGSAAARASRTELRRAATPPCVLASMVLLALVACADDGEGSEAVLDAGGDAVATDAGADSPSPDTADEDASEDASGEDALLDTRDDDASMDVTEDDGSADARDEDILSDTNGDDVTEDSTADTSDGTDADPDVDRCALVSCGENATCVDGTCECDPGFEDDGSGACAAIPPYDPDVNGDGRLDILVLGTEQSIRRFNGEFSASRIATELQSILEGDAAHGLTVNVVAEDLHLVERGVSVGLGQNSTAFSYDFHGHSLAQYYHWPAERDARRANLRGESDTDWDQVIIGADPYIVANVPGFFAVGVNEIADSVRAGGAEPRLIMVWPFQNAEASVDHIEEFTWRAADGARTPLTVIPAGRAWSELPAELRDASAPTNHPSPNGSYLAAAAIYTQLFGQSASMSTYTYNDDLADFALAAVNDAASEPHYAGGRTFVSPFAPAEIPDRILNYNHTGTSSENGILAGLRWVLERARVQLVSGGDAPIDFNYGRANTNFEPDKRYRIAPLEFDFSLGFPMQDHSSTGNTTMLYGIDYRGADSENGTDLGTAFYMIANGELPRARAVPIRLLFARLREAGVTETAYRDAWHMNSDLDRASAAFMYTMLTGHCALDAEPADTSSAAWRSWSAHRVGYETAWTMMHLRAIAPCFRVLPESASSTSVTPSRSTTLDISFLQAPTRAVTVRITTDNDEAMTVSPTELVFTPENHANPQTVTLVGRDGVASEERVIIAAETTSTDPNFDGLTDRWEYVVLDR